MNQLLKHVRVMLVAVPLVLTLMNIGDHSYTVYTTLALLALLFTTISRYFPRHRLLLLSSELLYYSWLAYEYEGINYLLLFSTLIETYSQKLARTAAMLWGIVGAVCLTAIISTQAAAHPVPIIILWITSSALLYVISQYESRNEQMEHLYDKLTLQHIELEAARARMLDYAKQVELYAQTEERNRIAKDIHDDLGHRLIRVKMMAEAAVQLHDVDTSRTRAFITGIRDQLQDSMETMRRTVHQMAEPVTGSSRQYALDRLLEQTKHALGINISLYIQGQPVPLYPSIEFILYKNAQEAITNAVRHGQADEITIELSFNARTVAMTISNNGALPDASFHEGLGIRGMKERIALISGTLEWQFEPSFSITTTLPLMGSTASRKEHGL